MAEIIISIITIILSFLLVWYFAYRPIIQIQNDLSIKIISEIESDIQSSHNLITTLSASAIVLSFSVLQAFKDKSLIDLGYLENSWYLFGSAILFGVLVGIMIYGFKALSYVVIKQLVDHHEEKEIDKTKLSNLASTKRLQQKMLFGFLFAQSASFVAAIAFLIAFAKNNLR